MAKKPTGPVPERLKIKMNWGKAVKKALKKPPTSKKTSTNGKK